MLLSRRRTRTPRWLCVCLATAKVFAQQPGAPSGETVIRLDVQQVLVPVIVTDKKGHHTGGLRAKDFRVLEDGVPQEITAFSTDIAGSLNDVSTLSKAPVPAPAGVRRTYVICVDTLHTLPASAGRIREALESFFKNEKSTDAQYVLIGIGRQLQVLQTATSNPLAILTKVRNSLFQNALGGADALAFAAQTNDLKSRMDDFCRKCSCRTRSILNSCEGDTVALKDSVDALVARWTPVTDGLTAQFRNVVEELAKLPTGRSLILVSDGFSLDPKRDFYRIAASYLPGQQFGQVAASEIDPRLREALRIAALRDVIIYPIDSRGAEAPTLSSSSLVDAAGSGGNHEVQSVIASSSRQTPATAPIRSTSLQISQGLQSSGSAPDTSATMEQMAKATGGVYTHESRDLLKPLRAAISDGREYYLLTYVPKNATADGKFRTITVEVNDKSLSVRAKAGYWATRSDQ